MARFTPHPPFRQELRWLLWKWIFCRRGIHWGRQAKVRSIQFKDNNGALRRIWITREYCVACGQGNAHRKAPEVVRTSTCV